MLDSNGIADQGVSSQDSTKEANSPTNWTKSVTSGFLVLSLVVSAWEFGHRAGVSEAGIQYQERISDLKDELASETTAEKISQNNEASAMTQLKQWQEAYNTLLNSDKSLANQDNALKLQIQQLDQCSYIEREIDGLNNAISSGFGTDETRKRRDSIQEQLSTCRH